MEGTFTDEVTAVNEALAKKIGQRKFQIWFKNSTRFSLTGGYLKIDVPNPFMAKWIENHFSNEINSAVREATGSDKKITFAIDPQLTGHQRPTHLDSQSQPFDKLRAVSPSAVSGSTELLAKTSWPNGNVEPHISKPQQRQVSAEEKTYPEKKLRFTLDTFIVGPSNELAYNAARAVANEPQSPFNPLFIHGGYGVGKTHLLQGICNAISAKKPKVNWLYLSAEDFVNQFVLALKLRKLEQFRHKMRQTDLLAIDDIHFLASKPSTQEEFLHTFNTINLACKQLVLASDAHPKMIGQLSEKLVNRFVSGIVVRIDNPDFRTRCEICRRRAETLLKNSKFQPSGQAVPENVIRYIAENLRTNVRELEGALLKLVAFSSLQNEKITLAMAQTVLAEHLERCDPIVHVSDIESAVATYFGITPANIHSSKKDRTVALARHFSMYLIRNHTKMSSSEIGRLSGNKNHATVLLACRKVEELLNRNAELHWQGLAGNKIAKAKDILAHLEASI